MKNYPFINPDPNLQHNLMAFGYECNKGWYPLIEETFDLLQSMNLPKEFEITQVKEKYGELRIYCNIYREDIENIIENATNRSLMICENCGKEGKLRIINEWWFVTRCDECIEKEYELEEYRDIT